MIRVQFDHQIFSLQKYGGISRYFANLQNYIDQSADFEQQNGVLFTTNYYLRQNGLIPLSIGSRIFKRQRKIYRWNKRYSVACLKFNSYDIFHPSYYDPYFLPINCKPFVLTVHDMIHELFPENFDKNDVSASHKKACILRAKHIIAISNHTKKDLQRFFDIPDDQITVIHHGINLAPVQYCTVSNLPKRYILYVGERAGYKNFKLLVEAFSTIAKADPGLYLVLAGGSTLTIQENALLTDHKIKEVTLQITPSDNELNTIYKSAQCFVFPSLYEGFGLPVLEAFKNNCAVVLSDSSCFPEIAGKDAALYFDPHSVHSLILQLQLILYNPDKKADLIKHGREKLLEYSIERCVRKTLNTYKTIINDF